MPAAITTRQLIDLKTGTMLTVRLQSGREIKARLRRTPELRCVGKPGIHRVRLEVADVDALAKLGDNATIMHALGHYHTIAGDRVVSIDVTP